MSFHDLEEQRAPGEILKKRFLEPNKCSVNRFAALAKLSLSDLKDMLRDGLWSHRAIRKISNATNTAPRYWYYRQSHWLFQKYINSGRPLPLIAPIHMALQEHEDVRSPGYILENNFLRPTGRNYNSLEKLIGVNAYELQNLVKGKLTVTPLIAYRLSRSFDTTTKYWLDLQSGYQVHLLLKSNLIRSHTIISSLARYRDRVYSEAIAKKIFRTHPGKFLLNQFLKPSGIPLKDWRHLFCFSRKGLRNILNGKTEMPLALIINVSRVFKTDAGLWIEMQNQFYANKADKHGKNLSRKPQKVLGISPGLTYLRHPFELLIDDFLRPMHISISRFMRHIGMDGKRFEHLRTGRKKIDFELAIRIGQALDTGPLYWINMQLEFDICSYEKVKGEQLLHLN